MDNTTPPRRSTAPFWILIVLLSLGLLASLALNAGLGAALAFKSTGLSHLGQAADEHPQLNEIWSYGEGDTKVARIALRGGIFREAQSTGLFDVPTDKVEEVLRQIRAAANDDAVKGILMEIDSPGGAITPSDEIYAALQDFRSSATDRVVVVFMRDLCASGGYYVAMAGDWLMAEPTTVVGSIGVIMQSLNIKSLSEKIGVRDVTIKSGRNKDLLNPFADVPEDQRALLQTMIDGMYGQFFDIVKESRPIEEARLRELADGRIFLAKEALELALIDDIGYFEDAVAKAADLLGVETVKVVRYEEGTDFWSRLLQARAPLPPVTRAGLSDWLRPQVMYLWNP